MTFFQEALGCFQNGNFIACVSMCGASMENLLFDLLLYNHKKAVLNESGTFITWSNVQEFKDGKFRDYFRELVSSDDNRTRKRKDVIKNLNESKIIDDAIADEIILLLNLRDQAMHYTENTWRRYFSNFANTVDKESLFWPFNERKAIEIIESSLKVLSYASD